MPLIRVVLTYNNNDDEDDGNDDNNIFEASEKGPKDQNKLL